MVRMKSLVCSLMALGFAVSMAGRAHGRNVELLVPSADAMVATDVSNRPTGVVKFFIATQKYPEILRHLGSYLATPRSGAGGLSDQRACHEAFHWTRVDLEKRAQRAGANAVVNIVSYYRKKEMASAVEFECHVGNVIVTVWLKGDLVKIA
ncbi:MAG TPA: hypothetical protein VF208_03005, partial [Candidatus Binatia bacterium]